MPYLIEYCTHAMLMDRLQLQQHQPIEMMDIGITIRIVPVLTGQPRRRPPPPSFTSDDDIGYDTTAMTRQLTTRMMTTTNTI